MTGIRVWISGTNSLAYVPVWLPKYRAQKPKEEEKSKTEKPKPEKKKDDSKPKGE
jgi:hypothetical protein